VTWNGAVERLREDGRLDGIPEAAEKALSAVFATRGGLYRAVRSMPDLKVTPAAENLALATEYAVTALSLQQKALRASGWSAASRLLLADGLLTLAFELVGVDSRLDLERFSTLVSQLLGESDPEARMEELLAYHDLTKIVKDTATSTGTEETG